jgi:hypothetical protein
MAELDLVQSEADALMGMKSIGLMKGYGTFRDPETELSFRSFQRTRERVLHWM